MIVSFELIKKECLFPNKKKNPLKKFVHLKVENVLLDKISNHV